VWKEWLTKILSPDLVEEREAPRLRAMCLRAPKAELRERIGEAEEDEQCE
jgi:hypothetical protein